jgi:hypothetical protein
LVKVLDDSKSFSKTDIGEELVWLSVEEIKTSFFKPNFIPSNIDKILNSSNILHVIEESDR